MCCRAGRDGRSARTPLGNGEAGWQDRRPVRSLLPLTVALLLLAALPGCAWRLRAVPEIRPGPAEEVAESLEIVRLADGVWVVTHTEPWAANALLVETPDGALVLCDTPHDETTTRELLRWMDRRFGPRPTIAVNTHFHAHALGGNRALLQAGMPVYGCDLTVSALGLGASRMRAGLLATVRDSPHWHAVFRDAAWQPPDHVFAAAEGLRMIFGGEAVEVLFPGPAHSPDNVVVHFPARRLLFGGGLVSGADGLGSTTDADLRAWDAALDVLADLDPDVVVPGHGRRFHPDILEETREMLREARR